MLNTVCHRAQFCVIGGGLAGLSAAIQAARHGIETVLIHERPIPGGNASSEIRMWVGGSSHFLESGIVEELMLENRCRNPQRNYSIWDSILYEAALKQEHLFTLLNCTCLDAEMHGSRIHSVKGYQLTTEQFHLIEADYFCDCSGDGILAPLTGAEFRMGREAKAEFGETLAQEEADRKTMGLSCLLQARETPSPKHFTPPDWAYVYPSDDDLPKRGNHLLEQYQNFWWIEYGGELDSIADTEAIRDELLKIVFGVWDHIKNRGDHGAENWQLDWVGFLPGKRESRRFMGLHLLTEKEVMNPVKFPDSCAYGGWPMDDHHPKAFYYNGPANNYIRLNKPYWIPARSLVSRNIENLLFAGRNISATHVAISSTRVMRTCAVLGQAAGTIAALALKENRSLASVCLERAEELRKILMDDGCFIPGFQREIAEPFKSAKLISSGGDAEPLRNGYDRALGEQGNAWRGGNGDWVEYDFGEIKELASLRIMLDSDFEHRECQTMEAQYPLEAKSYPTPETLIRDLRVEADGQTVWEVQNNHQYLLQHTGKICCRKLKLIIEKTGGVTPARIFSFDGLLKSGGAAL